jgi:lipopolysaccharide assembly protein A
MKPKTIFIMVMLLLFGIIVIQNTEVTGVQFLFWKVEMSRAILLPIIFIAGLIIGFLGCLIITKKKDRNHK